MNLTRRTFLEMAAMTATANMAPASGIRKPLRRPNIIFMLGDDHRADVMGCAGNSIVKTPHLDLMASEGVLFENHFCTTPICCVSRASIMLGQYASTHGIKDFDTSLTQEQLRLTYFNLIREGGYHTGFVGKFGVGKNMPKDSFDVWEGFPGQGNYFPKGEPGPHLTHIMRDQANDFLRTAPVDKPFLLSISFKAPHVQDDDPRQYLASEDTLPLYAQTQIPPPIGASSEDINRFPLSIQRSENRHRWGIRFATPALYQESIKGYYRLVSGIDSAIGSIRETLAKQGLADNTIIIYSADHGIFNGEHGFAGKWYAHEESIRIPLIIYDPRLPAPVRGARRQETTLNLDLYPTLLEMAGIVPPSVMQGRSILKYLSSESKDSRQVFFVEHDFPFHGFIPSSGAIRTDGWKYIRYTDVAAPFEELYDLREDKFETHNLVTDSKYEHQLNTLRSYYETWKKSFLNRDELLWHDPITDTELKRDGLS